MDDMMTPERIPAWYRPAAIASLLFMLLGCAGLVMHVMTDPVTLPLDQRALFEAEPSWVLAASAVGFLAGAVGALMLALRRKAGERLMLVSLAGMIVWAIGMAVTPKFRDLLSTGQIAVLIAVLAIDWTIFWFARHS